MSDMDKAVSNGLRRLASFAPEFDGVRQGRPPARRVGAWVVLSAAAAVALIVFGGVWLGLNSPETDDNGPMAAQSSPTASSAGRPARHDLTLGATRAWPTTTIATCDEWNPAGRDEVVIVEGLEDTCVTSAPFDQTTVLIGPYDSAILGESWDRVTEPWRTVQGHDIRRLTAGTLPTISSRYIDAVACPECDRVILVLGPDPSVVERLVQSVE